MKQRFVVVMLLVVAALLLASSSAWSKSFGREQATPQQKVYFGFLLGTSRLAAVAIDVAASDENGQRALRAYVCDGFGPPEGMAIWFRSDVDAAQIPGAPALSVTSAGGQETLDVIIINDQGVYGAFTDSHGETAQFVAYPAFDGAGIYQVTLDQALHYKGTSTDGAVLDAQASSDGATEGSITIPGGKQILFRVYSLALADPADLVAQGLSPDFNKYVRNNQIPGAYVAVIAPGGSHWLGRSGSVTTGVPSGEIIGLDVFPRKR